MNNQDINHRAEEVAATVIGDIDRLSNNLRDAVSIGSLERARAELWNAHQDLIGLKARVTELQNLLEADQNHQVPVPHQQPQEAPYIPDERDRVISVWQVSLENSRATMPDQRSHIAHVKNFLSNLQTYVRTRDGGENFVVRYGGIRQAQPWNGFHHAVVNVTMFDEDGNAHQFGDEGWGMSIRNAEKAAVFNLFQNDGGFFEI
ncbi:predicted protein [Chaetoceros tenuissimus]|uniref:Uncharacterized protein n=1 Tax=Chaetoceros tenuissimus TaxID=426638 RepID=A0AAD3H620_9STRA|nr:predicted protein [Chaetoceros tenuissimus]